MQKDEIPPKAQLRIDFCNQNVKGALTSVLKKYYIRTFMESEMASFFRQQ